MKRLVVLSVIVSLYVSGYAYDCFIDGIYYNLDNDVKEATVTYKKKNEKCKDYKGDIVIPEKISFQGNTYTVTAIGEMAFYGNRQLTSIVIPNTVTNIYSGAFWFCKSLKNVYLPNQLRTITPWSFYCCESLESISFPNTIHAIEEWAFTNCRSLTEVTLPGTVTNIGMSAFASCKGLRKINIPPSVESIGKNAFLYCESLEKVLLPAQFYKKSEAYFPGRPIVEYCGEAPVTSVAVKDDTPDTDIDIPRGNRKNDNTFALIIANENYQHEAFVPWALNDGKIFSDYMQHTLGLPKENITLYEDATINEIRFGLTKLENISKALDGDISLIVYYAGHGIPDASSREAYLLPSDGSGSDISSAFPLKELYSRLSAIPSAQSLLFIDACFSGAQRDGDMMRSTRGVRLKPKHPDVNGKLVVFSSTKEDQTALPFKEKKHGLFTYFLLKKLQETSGDVSLQSLAEYIKTNVQQTSALKSKHLQTPVVINSPSMQDWGQRSITIK